MLYGSDRPTSDLIDNIDKIHITVSGAERIRRNLNLQADDIVSWCIKTVKHADIIFRRGKNWYAYGCGVAITINANSYTVITAHKINAKVRISENLIMNV